MIQERPPGERHSRYSGRCLLEGPSGACREVRSPNGIRVMLATDGSSSLESSALLGGTLVNVSGSRITEPELLAYFDALRPVEPDELEFKRGLIQNARMDSRLSQQIATIRTAEA